MRIENEFTVPAPVDRLWAYLPMSNRSPCMPGAKLTETVDDTTWKGKVNMKPGRTIFRRFADIVCGSVPA